MESIFFYVIIDTKTLETIVKWLFEVGFAFIFIRFEKIQFRFWILGFRF